MARPAIPGGRSSLISVRVSPETKDTLRKLAVEEDRTVGTTINRIIRQYLEARAASRKKVQK